MYKTPPNAAVARQARVLCCACVIFAIGTLLSGTLLSLSAIPHIVNTMPEVVGVVGVSLATCFCAAVWWLAGCRRASSDGGGCALGKNAHARRARAGERGMRIVLLLLLLVYAKEMRPQGEHFPQSKLADGSKSSKQLA